MQQDVINGVISHARLDRKDDYLYRLSVKGVVINDNNEVLVVKESDRTFWDLPGGGMDHGETIKDALAREMYEEVSLTGDFDYRIIAVEDPMYLKNARVLQVRLIFHIIPKVMEFTPGVDSAEIRFMDVSSLNGSTMFSESMVYKYARLALKQT